MLGLAGSAPSVAVSGYTFGGGIGWLTRPHGMASSALRRVEYVTGDGEIRIAADDAAEAIDREALWAFRGGGGAGIATWLEFDLVPVTNLHAGYLLWPAEALRAVVSAYAAALTRIGPDAATSMSVLHLPDAPAFPDPIRGRPAVHLAVAASSGDGGALPLLAAVRKAATALVDTWGPADVAALSGIHLDPPAPVPAIGDARWLTADAPGRAVDLLSLAASANSPLALVEIRNVGNTSDARPGALTSVPGPYIVHAVAPLADGNRRPAVTAAFAELRDTAAAADAGRSVGSWMEGATSVPDALDADTRNRVRRIADAVDPHHVIARSRYLN